MSIKKNQSIFQFKITLLEINPPIYRKIQVPDSYSFWDLHVALQDAMGWLDYHLHAFRFYKSNQQTIEIGIPDNTFDDLMVLPGWDVAITDYFKELGDKALYEYDFGDGWQHEVLLEGILLREKGVKYPNCIAGKRACPPEDCGSVSGYYHLLEILEDPSNDEYEDTIEWLKGHAKNYYPYLPDEFDAGKVKFDNPKTRLKKAFSVRG
jgi:Plasmid pRiA4b ORF-3-like protein